MQYPHHVVAEFRCPPMTQRMKELPICTWPLESWPNQQTTANRQSKSIDQRCDRIVFVMQPNRSRVIRRESECGLNNGSRRLLCAVRPLFAFAPIRRPPVRSPSLIVTPTATYRPQKESEEALHTVRIRVEQIVAAEWWMLVLLVFVLITFAWNRRSSGRRRRWRLSDKNDASSHSVHLSRSGWTRTDRPEFALLLLRLLFCSITMTRWKRRNIASLRMQKAHTQ